MTRITIALVVSLSLTATTSTAQTIDDLLQSHDPREQAWGAWAAQAHFRPDLVPRLERLIEQHSSTDGLAAVALDNALDALIQMKAVVPEALLRAVFPRRPAATLILLSRVKSNELLLEIINAEQGTRWFAASNLLLTRSEPEFVLSLLRNVQIAATVVVSDGGSRYVSSVAGGVSVGCGSIGLAQGYPPWATYQLTTLGSTGNVVLALGPRPVYYERRVATAGSTPLGNSHDIDGPSTNDRFEYLATKLHRRVHELPLRATVIESIKTTDSIPAAVERLKGDILFRYSALVQLFMEHGAITGLSAATLPEPTIHIEIIR